MWARGKVRHTWQAASYQSHLLLLSREMKKSDALSARIEQILTNHDPEALIVITKRPREYRGEAEMLIRRLPEDATEAQIEQVLGEVFEERFKPAPPPVERRDRLKAAARDIFTFLQGQ